jgi:hypothetical protein
MGTSPRVGSGVLHARRRGRRKIEGIEVANLPTMGWRQPFGAAAATSIPEAAKPTSAMRPTQTGGNKTPPRLAPLRVRLSAFGRSRSNQRATMALMAALLVVA